MISITSYAKGKKSSSSSSNGGGGFANTVIKNSNGISPFYLWGQYIDGRDNINGDLISNGTINGNKLVAPQGDIDLIHALSEYVNYISGHTAIFDNLSGDTGHFNQDVFVGGDIDIEGDTNIGGDTVIEGDLSVSGDTHLTNLWTQNITNSDTIKTKNLEVSGLAHFFQLVIDRIKAAGGAILLTPADGFETALVEEDESGYTLYFHAKDGERQINNMWEVNDQAICQTFNASTGTSYNVSNTYYWALVTDVSEQAVQKTVSGITEEYHYIKLSKSVYDGELNPKIGDEIAMLGSRNENDPQRQSAIYMAAYTSLDQGLTAPCFAEYKGINDFSLLTHRHSYIDATGASFTGDFRIDNNTTIQDYVNSATTEVRNEFRFDTEGLYSRVSKMTNPNILPANGWTDQNDNALLQEDDEEYIFKEEEEEPQQQRSMAKGGFSEDVVSEDLIGMPPIIYLNSDTYTFSIYSQVKFKDIQYGYEKDNLNMTLPVQTTFNSGDTWHNQSRAITTFYAPIDGYYHLGAKMMDSGYTGDYEYVDPDAGSGYTPSESAITTTIQISMNQGTTILINSTNNKATATITPSDFGGTVVWSSSNPNACTIDQNGNITIVSTGSTTISATIPEQYHNGKHYLGSSDSLSIAVTDQVQTEVTLTAPSVMEYGSSENYAVATVTPSSYNGQVQYSTSNSNIATIDSDGNINIVNAGQFTIYAVAPQTIQNGVTYLSSSAHTLCRVTREMPTTITFETTSGDHIGSGTSQDTWTVVCNISPMPSNSAITVTVDGQAHVWSTQNDKLIINVGKGAHTFNVSVAEYKEGEITYLSASESLEANFFKKEGAVTISAIAPSQGLTQGETYNLSATTEPSGAHLTYSSNNPSIATVNSGGTITAVSTGSTYVTIYASEFFDRTNYLYYPSSWSAQYGVSVYNAQYINITNLTPDTLTYGEWFDLAVSATPATTIAYSSSNPSVIDVDEDGIVQAYGDGTATITIIAQGFTDSVNNIKYLTTTKTINVQATVAEIPQNVMPNNEIWYTNSSGITIDFNPTAFGDNLTVVSNTYSNDKGVVVLSDIVKKVDGRVTTNADDVFELSSIHLPASIVSMDGSALGCDFHEYGAFPPSSVNARYIHDVYLYTNNVPRGLQDNNPITLHAESDGYYNWNQVSPNKDTHPLPMGAYGWITYPNGVQCYHMKLVLWSANYHVMPKALNEFRVNKYFNKSVTNNSGFGYLCQDLSDYTVSATTLTVDKGTTYMTDVVSVISSEYTSTSGLRFQSFSATTLNGGSFYWDSTEGKYGFNTNYMGQDDVITINFDNIVDGNGILFIGSGSVTINVQAVTAQNTITHDLPYYPLIANTGFNLKASSLGEYTTPSYSSSNPSIASVNNQGKVTANASGTTIITITTPRDADENYIWESASTIVNITVESRPQYETGFYEYLQGSGADYLVFNGVFNGAYGSGIDLRNYSVYIDNNGRQGEGVSGSTGILEFQNSYGTTSLKIEYSENGGLFIGHNGNYAYQNVSSNTASIYDRNVLSIRNNDGYYVNDTKIGNINYSGDENQYFRCTANLKVYGMKLYSGNTLCYDFKPYAQNGKPGLYDSASNTFLGSQLHDSTGFSFILGGKYVTSSQTISYISLPQSGLTIGDTFNLNASTTPSGGTLSYSSSNPSIATVDSNGIISALTTGSTTITITASAYDDSVNHIRYSSASTSMSVDVSEAVQPSYDPLKDSGYFVIKSIANNPTIKVYTNPNWMSGTISYRKNGEGDWTTIPSSGTTNISTQTDDYIEFKGDAVISGTVSQGLFSTNVENSIEVGGWLMALNKNGEINSSNNMLDGARLKALFRNCTGTVSAQYLKFPTDTTDRCYTQMFYLNKNLITPPSVLPATEVYDYSYTQMFQGCSNLATAPVISGRTLAAYCFNRMFQGCSSLTTGPELLADTLVDSCYIYMFSSCSSLTSLTVHFSQLSTSRAINNWLNNIKTNGTLYCPSDATYTSSNLRLPSTWTLSKTL